MTEETLTSNDFILLFSTLLELKLASISNSVNTFTANHCFNIAKLKNFIYLSKRDPKYANILACFKFHELESIDLIIALNNAKLKHIITVIVDDFAYLSRTYSNYNVLRQNESFIPQMEEFISDYYSFTQNPEYYLAFLEDNIAIEEKKQIENDRLVYELKHTLKP